jgi:hypothetical protein
LEDSTEKLLCPTIHIYKDIMYSDNQICSEIVITLSHFLSPSSFVQVYEIIYRESLAFVPLCLRGSFVCFYFHAGCCIN